MFLCFFAQSGYLLMRVRTKSRLVGFQHEFEESVCDFLCSPSLQWWEICCLKRVRLSFLSFLCQSSIHSCSHSSSRSQHHGGPESSQHCRHTQRTITQQRLLATPPVFSKMRAFSWSFRIWTHKINLSPKLLQDRVWLLVVEINNIFLY